MTEFTDRHAKERGFTLLELLMAIFLSMGVLAAGYTVFQGSSRATTQQNLDNRMQDNARVAMDVLARNIRRAGFLVNFPSYNQNILSGQIEGQSIKIIPNNSNAVPDQISVVGGTLTSVGTLAQSVPRGATSLILSTASTITVGDIIGLGYTFSGRVTNVAGNTVTLDNAVPTGATNMAYPGDDMAGVQEAARVRRLTTTLYRIDAATDPLHPVLQQTTQNTTEPVAEDIEDLQIAYGVDRNNNRIIEDNEWTWAPPNNEINLIRLVRITIVARSAQPDPALIGRAQTIPAIEDRPAQNNVLDGFRRYILTRMVKARNIDVIFAL
jgi:type IV pilus assembly protein PilW